MNPAVQRLGATSRMLLTGDVHRNLGWWVDHVIPTAQAQDCSLILQLGDFGVWPGEAGMLYLDRLQAALAAAGLNCCFVDGNHEDFSQLDPASPEPRALRPLIHHLPRGFRWHWGGARVMTLGGAASLDRNLRREGVNWWAGEMITEADVERCLAGGDCDLLLCHDVPAGLRTPGSGDPRRRLRIGPSTRERIQASRGRLQQVVNGCRPVLVVHGHWHRSHDLPLDRPDGETTRVIGLSCDSAARGDPDGH